MSTISEQNNCDEHLHAEIDTLKQALVDKQNQLIAMETACLRESDRQVELEDSIIAWQDKYDRLYESHKRVQKLNQNLEDKLLKLVDRNSSERAQLTSDVATLSVRLAQANYNIAKLQREIDRYKTDINLAIKLLQCKPDNFVQQKVSSLPLEIQSKVSSYMRLETNSHSDSEEGSTSGIGVPTSGSYKVLPASDSPPPACPFPPTAMVYSMRGLDAQLTNNSNNINHNHHNNNNNNNCNINTDQMISPSIMAKFLEDELKTGEVKHCDTCQCSIKDLTVLADVSKTYTIGTQTTIQGDGNSLCLRCNSNLNSPSRTNSPYLMKLVKSSDSVISETKSSVSDLNDTDKLFTPAKKDDLMVNPILGHHRLCDRTLNKISTLTIQQQQQYNDTAKYIMENSRKFDGDLIDLRKYSEKSLIDEQDGSGSGGGGGGGGSGDCRKVFNNSNLVIAQSQEIKQNVNDSCRKSDNINLIIDSTNCEFKNVIGNSNGNGNGSGNGSGNLNTNVNGITSGNGSNISGGTGSLQGNLKRSDENREKKIELQDETDVVECNLGNGDKQNLNSTTICGGSMNSVWSKTSDAEGAKMFETFNRNLIKTIKAENPKYRGPRLCALRIQNGSHNILLDNMDTTETKPIIYTRRQRFLDEELDDTKDIITSIIAKPNPSDINMKDIEIETEQINENVNNEIHCNESVISHVNDQNNSDMNLDQEILKSQQNNINSDRILTNSFLEQQFNTQMTTEQQKQFLKASFNYDMLNFNETSCKHSINSKTCTQSSSVSDAIDLQETAMLRRQQLNRVAEWVQNNSKIDDQQNNGGFNTTLDSLPSSASMEKLSVDSGYKTTQPPIVNGLFSNYDIPNSNDNHSKFINPKPLQLLKTPLQSNSHLSSDSIAQNNFILNFKYFHQNVESDNDETDDAQPLNTNRTNSNNIEQTETEKAVDLAQMEYNVKQFLLKQNEWSIRSSQNISSSGSSYKNKSTPGGAVLMTTTTNPTTASSITQNFTNNNNNNNNNSYYYTSSCLNLNGNNSAGNSANTNQTSPYSSASAQLPQIFKSHPHRTETNL